MRTHLRFAQSLADLLDNHFKFAGFRFGLDPILGLIPFAGGVVTGFLSLYIVWIAIGMKLPADKIAMMMGNVAFDFLLHFIPVLGQLTDFVFKANSKNMEILKKYVGDEIIDGEVLGKTT